MVLHLGSNRVLGVTCCEYTCVHVFVEYWNPWPQLLGKALPLGSYEHVLFSSWCPTALGPLSTSQEPLKDKLGSALGLCGTGMFSTNEALGLIPSIRQAAKGSADSAYVKESPVPLASRDKGGKCKPDARLNFRQGNAYLTIPERLTAHSPTRHRRRGQPCAQQFGVAQAWACQA